MIRFTLFGFPVQVQPFFWLTCLFLGGGLYASTQQDYVDLLSWALVMFVSILAHELGHAWAGRHFGVRPGIALHGLGGLTVLPGARFTRRESVLVSAAGPAVSLILGALFIGGAVWAGRGADPTLKGFLNAGLFINLVWTAFNLLPIQPMDGGQILRDLLGPRRFVLTCWIGAVLAAALAIWAVLAGQYFMAVLAGYMAWVNYQGRGNLPGGVKTQDDRP